MTTEEDKIKNIYNLLNCPAHAVYNEVYLMRGISIANKLKIISACINDQKEIDINGKDPNNRNNKIKLAGKSLQELVARHRIKNNV